MHDIKEFIFSGYDIDLAQGRAVFHYSIQLASQSQEFTERITFSPVVSQIPDNLLKALLDNLLLILGISYWKLYCPQSIIIKPFNLTKQQVDFWNTVYTKGLGEFFYKNKIDFRNLVSFPYKEHNLKPVAFVRQDRPLLALGGGKDSIVSAELLKTRKIDFDLFTVGTSIIQEEVAKIIGRKVIVINREIDAKLFQLNKNGQVYNGHIPISVIYAFLGLLAAIFYDYRGVVVSNEKSANYGNVEYLGEMINHQWSKSEEFENLFKNYVKSFITPDVSYYSLLRKYNEIEIAELFVKYKKYFSAFSSCNNNFKINEKVDPSSKWCGKCPKCLFVFILLSGFIQKQELIGIFGRNLFEDQSLLPIFKELLGVKDFKPFECVGTPAEVTSALNKAYERGELNETSLMKFYKHEI